MYPTVYNSEKIQKRLRQFNINVLYKIYYYYQNFKSRYRFVEKNTLRKQCQRRKMLHKYFKITAYVKLIKKINSVRMKLF